MEHMERDQIRKCGLRFWFPAGDNSSIAERIERGPTAHAPVPSWQFDRGRFENYLGERNHEAGIDLFGATRVVDVEVGDPHRVTIAPRAGGDPTTVTARWIVDASGRSWILKHKLGLLEDNGHVVNSSWFRLAGGLNIEDWADPDDEEFFGRMSEPRAPPVQHQPPVRQGLLDVDDPALLGRDLDRDRGRSALPLDGRDEHAGQVDRLDPRTRAPAR